MGGKYMEMGPNPMGGLGMRINLLEISGMRWGWGTLDGAGDRFYNF